MDLILRLGNRHKETRKLILAEWCDYGRWNNEWMFNELQKN